MRKVLEETDPELASDLMEHGILLAGGGSQLLGLDAHLTEVTQGLRCAALRRPCTLWCMGCWWRLSSSIPARDLLQ